MANFSFKEVAPCLFAIFIDILGFGLVAPLLVAIFTSPEHNLFEIDSSNLRYFFLGVTLAIYPLFMFFGTAFIGDLSDVIGRKKTLLLSMAGMAGGFLLMSLGIGFGSLFVFLLGRSVSGLVAASQSVALATISDLSTKENKAIHLSYVALIQCIGFVVGPLAGGVLSGVTFYMPFIGAAFSAIVAYFWIFFSFEETLLKKSSKKISILRFIRVFEEAYQNARIRHLSLAFLMMQIGVAFYLPIILILLTTYFNYSPFLLGLFNGYLGVGFALSLLFVLPKALKRYNIEQVVCISLFVTLLAQLFSSIFDTELLLWLLAFPYAVAVELGFSGMFTAFSNASDESSQGWVMGISVAIMAIAWAFAGFSTQLVPLIGVNKLIFIGSLFLGISFLLMRKYCLKYCR